MQIVAEGAYLPSIASAINLDGNGDGGQVKIRVSRTDVAFLLQLAQHATERTFRLIVEIDEPDSR